MGDPFGPLHQGEELLVCCLADVGDWVIGLEMNEVEGRQNKAVNSCAGKQLPTTDCEWEQLQLFCRSTGGSMDKFLK